MDNLWIKSAALEGDFVVLEPLQLAITSQHLPKRLDRW